MACLAVVSVLSLAGAADAEESPRTISTSGNADIRVVPDEVEITLGIETRHRDLQIAKKQNDDRLAKIMGAIRALKIDPKSIQTDYLAIEPEYKTENNNERVVYSYTVRKNIGVVLRDIVKFDQLVADAVSAGTNHVHNIQFRTTQLRKHRDQARIMAIRAARDKAVALAKELGQKVGRPRTISEGHFGYYGPYSTWGNRFGQSQNMMQQAGPSEGSESPGLALGQIAISASISVTFELE
jgi:uncharacterized protein